MGLRRLVAGALVLALLAGVASGKRRGFEGGSEESVITVDERKGAVELRNSLDAGEDAECFCFKDIDFDEENDDKKEDWGQCAGLTDGSGCDDFCASRPEKYKVFLGGESGAQSISYCQDDGDCKCLDVNDSEDWDYEIIYNFKGGSAKMNLAACYAGCNQMCKAIKTKKWEKGGCVWPFRK